MRANRWAVLAWATLIAGCATAAATSSSSSALGPVEPSETDVITPLGAHLTASAKTGAPVPLRIDPNAHVVIATFANLPAASYSATQATRGEQVFASTCAACHQDSQFIGQTFVDNWNNRRVSDFYELVRTTMPVDNPGGLKDQDYLDVVAYLLKANHATAAMDSLSADTTALRGHRIAVHP